MRKKTKKTREIIQDQELLKKISPVGRISHHETYTRTGTGYEACIHIWDFPAGLNDYWLTKACNQPNTITTISILTKDQTVVKKNLNKSIQEQDSRKRFAKEYKDFYDAAVREEEMKKLYDEINSLGEVIKSIEIRIFAVAKTRMELENSVAGIIKNLEADNYRAAVFLNESERDWKSVYQSATKQVKEPHAITGFPLKASRLAAGNAFHFSSLEDDYGDYLGDSKCGGNILFDEFTRSDIRVNGSAVLFGKQRFGKSTLMKKRMKSRALRGDFVRIFDITGENSELVKRLGGRVLNMDGTDGIINFLEIFRAGDTEHTSFARHMSKLKTSYQFINPQADIQEIVSFQEIVQELYRRFQLLPGEGKQITGLSAKTYPRLQDLLELIEETTEELSRQECQTLKKVLVEERLLNLEKNRKQIKMLIETYGYMFNGWTSIDKMSDIKVVSYNLTQIKDLSPEIFDLQLFNLLSLSWDDAITNGSVMKKLWEEKKIALKDVVHFILYIDESHRWVNANKLFALELLGIYLREAPKYFGAIWLASQSIRDYVPEGSTVESIDKLKSIFELAQYKFIFHQDSNTLPIIERVFENVLTFSQKEQIPRLQRGETILCISGDQNIEFNVYLSSEEERLFAGGA